MMLVIIAEQIDRLNSLYHFISTSMQTKLLLHQLI